MEPEASKPDRALIVVLAVTAALVVISLIVVFTRGAPMQFAAETPQGVVQRYTEAVLSGDESAAEAYLTPAAKADCDVFAEPWTTNIRVTLVSTTERNGSADVDVSIITTYDGGLFGDSEYTEPGTFDLVESGGDWLIESAPWQIAVCPG